MGCCPDSEIRNIEMYESIKVEVKDVPNYWCEVNLFDNVVNVEINYNTRTKKRLIKVSSGDDSIVFLKQSYIVSGVELHFNFSFQIYDLNVFVTLESKRSYESDDYLNWSKNYNLLFVSYDNRSFSPPTKILNLD